LIGPFSPPPRLKITAAAAPAACALSAFTRNVQVPRCIKAIRPATKPEKSLASQPLVLVWFGVAVVSTGCTFVVTSPDPEYVIVKKSTVSWYGFAFGETCSSFGAASSWKNANGNSWIVTRKPLSRSLSAT
jgi:hypothetical protein